MSALGDRAVVLGAGMAGLLAARVLSEFYGTVTLVERDVLPDAPAQRRGVPHGRHLHALSSSGSHALEQLFPGLLDDLVAAGANVCDEGNLSRVSMQVGGHELNRSGTFAEPSALVLYIASRPLLESHVRQRVRAIDNVTVLDGHDVVEPIADQPHRVTGARVANRETSWFDPVQIGHAPEGSVASTSSTMARMAPASSGALMKRKLKPPCSSSRPSP